MSANWSNIKRRYKNQVDKLSITNNKKNEFKRRINNTFNTNVMKNIVSEANREARQALMIQMKNTSVVGGYVKNTINKGLRDKTSPYEMSIRILISILSMVAFAFTTRGDTNKLFQIIPMVAPRPNSMFTGIYNYAKSQKLSRTERMIKELARFVFSPDRNTTYSRASQLIIVSSLATLIGSISYTMTNSDNKRNYMKDVLYHMIKILKPFVPAIRKLLKKAMEVAMIDRNAGKTIRGEGLNAIKFIWDEYTKKHSQKNNITRNGLSYILNEMRRIPGDPSYYSPVRTGEKRRRTGNALVSETPGGSVEVRKRGKVYRTSPGSTTYSTRNTTGGR